MSTPSPIKAVALLARARYAHHNGQHVYVTAAERSTFPEPRGIPETLYGVPLTVDDTRAAAQIAAAIEHPAPPMGWETREGTSG